MTQTVGRPPRRDQDDEFGTEDGTTENRDLSDVGRARAGYRAFGPDAARSDDPAWLGALRRFVRRHGWRAYALPVLVVVTLVALITTGDRSRPSTRAGSPGPVGASGASSAPTNAASPSSTVKVDASNQNAEALASDALPPGADYTQSGKGTFTVLPGTSSVAGTSTTVRKYVIDYEDGISGVDLNAFASSVQKTLSDPRSWTGGGHVVALQRVSDPAQADFHISLTTPMTLRPLCGYDQKIETSCFQTVQGINRVTLNISRWVRGDTSFGQDIATYRIYMINHESGHALGHFHSFTCLPNGMAPVMMQQTITLKEQGSARICTPNVWPYPSGVDPRIAVSS